MYQGLFRFIFISTMVIGATYLIQIGVIQWLDLDRDMAMINFSYIFNSIFTLLLISGIVLVSNKFRDQLGFIFMAGSLIKIGLFMAVSKLSGFEINKNVFLDFFVAYVICLILEVYCVSRILNNHK